VIGHTKIFLPIREARGQARGGGASGAGRVDEGRPSSVSAGWACTPAKTGIAAAAMVNNMLPHGTISSQPVECDCGWLPSCSVSQSCKACVTCAGDRTCPSTDLSTNRSLPFMACPSCIDECSVIVGATMSGFTAAASCPPVADSQSSDRMPSAGNCTLSMSSKAIGRRKSRCTEESRRRYWN
jgi:hypothetical protein